MLRGFLRSSTGRFGLRARARWIMRHVASRRILVPLLLVLAAWFLDVWWHGRQYTVAVPAEEMDAPFHVGCQEPDVNGPRESAALVMLARNKELTKAVRSLQSLEDHFNRWFHYPYVFLNDEPWSEDFKRAVRAVVSSEARFEVIPHAEWTFPEFTDVDAARESIRKQGQANILYAGLESYHHMCRFYSKNFYTLEALRDYKWYWRVEPDVDFHCAITYDPFREMARQKKAYGFTIALAEEPRTCPSLFPEMAAWKEAHRLPTTELWKAMITPSWLPGPLRERLPRWLGLGHRNRQGDAWSMCHYWSNFEIADLDFFRGRGYQDMVKYLDRTGKFYTERWGDAAVHSLAVAMLLEPRQVHHFADFGYRHDWYFSCPNNAPREQQLLESAALNTDGYTDWAPERPGGIGCRCQCDGTQRSPHHSYCLRRLEQPNTRRRLGALGWVRSWFD